MSTGASAPAPRRTRDAEATQRAILGAAVDAFARSGYDGASTRDIARDAGIDPRLITRYFGSKEALFARAVEETYRHPLMMVPGRNRDVAEALLSDAPLEQAKGLLLTIRSAGNERAVEIMRDHLEQHYQRDLSDALAGPDPGTRAALLIAICTGVQMQRNVLRNRALQAADSATIIDLLAAALDLIGARGVPTSADGPPSA
ncbi:TetR/AcrR family transcriptional regulator [Planotetraspora kaengkrachanensis]|uniref:TetR family transcriptional regulator n=1 Tax=Planotetraspora kaengkrachanensis TaxID=575193 RepID=A0A8J3LXG8_9ACTN|nr:TetR/AcrR family transcriptional regulator [Planotetraspora kaengkrachanensis]GIG78500.1 TetR family transcriptional regulator [Planotetraspora kaengkrachanensis]